MGKKNHDWDAIVEEIGPRLYRYFLSRFKDEDASDLTQETLVRLVKKIEAEDFDPEKGNYSMYAFGIAHFVRLEKIRKQDKDAKNVEINEETLASETLEKQIIEKEQVLELKTAIKELSEVQQEIMGLMVDEEMAYPEISTLLNIPVNTIKSHVRRAKEKLIKLLKQEPEGAS